MHMVMVVVVGLILLAGFVGVSWLMNKPAQGGPGAGIPLLNEIGAFIPIFGIPAAAAWLYLRRLGQSFP